MRTLRIVIGLITLALLPLGATAAAQTGRLAEGNTLYLDNCSICHGVITTGRSERSRMPAIAAAALITPTMATGGASEPMVRVGVRAGRREVLALDGETRIAIAPPYGPSLRGVYGRPAGTVEGFTYSAEFLKVLRGVVWNRDTLNRWITDSQKWVAGSVMYYKQPDPEIRRRIIDYLEAAR